MYELCITYVASYKGKLEYPILTDDNIYSVANADIFHMSYKNIITGACKWCTKVFK